MLRPHGSHLIPEVSCSKQAVLPACLLDGRGVHYYFSPKFTRIWEKKQSIWEKGKAPSPSERLDEFLWLDDAAQPGFAVQQSFLSPLIMLIPIRENNLSIANRVKFHQVNGLPFP